MFFDIRSFAEWLTSSVWAWTTDACERLLASFGLMEGMSTAGRRDFDAPSGFRARLYSRIDGSPDRIEFPFALPDTLRGNPAAVDRYVELITGSLKPWLGEPRTVRDGAMNTSLWSLPAGTVTIGPDAASPGAVQNVALILQRPLANG